MPNRTQPGRIRGPKVIGTGLVALDVVIRDDGPENLDVWAGGTCGNVLSALSYLGWRACPIARLRHDAAGKVVVRDMRKWRVHVDLLHLEPSAATPVVIENLSRSPAGEPIHRFTWTCPGCGRWLPNYSPVLARQAQKLNWGRGSLAVFFFDRPSRGALILAEKAVAKGALVVFEVAGVGDPKLLQEAIDVAHVLKYSEGRRTDLQAMETERSLLELVTLGNEGVRYRSRLRCFGSSDWQNLRALTVTAMRDTAGAGDWCTAGLIDALGRNGLEGFQRSSRQQLRQAILYSQALAAWTCGFEGARGGMYEVTKRTFRSKIKALMEGHQLRSYSISSAGKPSMEWAGGTCDICGLEGSSNKHAKAV